MLDDILPSYDFSERHHRRVDATADATWQALAALTLDDLRVTRPLMALRHLTHSAGPSKPLLSDGPVTLLHRQDGRVAIGGSISRPWQLTPSRHAVSTVAEFVGFTDPGWTKYLTEFRVEPNIDRASCTLSTETRGTSTDARARRRFRLYWTVIRLPSGLIRREVLRAVARAATA